MESEFESGVIKFPIFDFDLKTLRYETLITRIMMKRARLAISQSKLSTLCVILEVILWMTIIKKLMKIDFKLRFN